MAVPAGTPIALRMMNGATFRHLREWRDPPDAGALRHEATQYDEQRILLGADEVKPHARNNNSHRKTGQARNQSAKKSCGKKERQRQAIHGSLPIERRAALGWRVHLMGRPRCPQFAILL
jgi:hypothetical protein